VIKAGFAGENTPRFAFPSVLGLPRITSHWNETRPEDRTLSGYEALNKSDEFALRYPIKRGVITNWKHMNHILYHTFFHRLHADPADHPVLITQSPFDTKHNHETMTQIMFEEQCVLALYVANPSVLPLYSTGHKTGIVIDVGGGSCHTVPVHEGLAISDAISHFECGGNDIDNLLMRMLNERGYSIRDSFSNCKAIHKMKEKLCYVAFDFDSEMKRVCSMMEKKYEMSDGQTIIVGDELFRCPECLFQPNLFGIDGIGVHEMILNSIMECDCDIQEEMFSKIVVCGGSTLFRGFVERLEKEITSISPLSTEINIITPSERQYSSWIGGSIIGSLPTFPNLCISQDDYDEYGPTVFHHMCP